MTSTILYKFRSGTTFEALPLPGSAARLFDVKKAIVLAKKLDQAAGSIEFDLSVKDAATNEEYVDEAQILPRGTRLVVQRLPAARGQGFLARMARAQQGMPMAGAMSAAPPSNFYTIESRPHDDDDEFVSSAAVAASAEEKELAALRAATETASPSAARTSTGVRPPMAGRSGPGRGAGAMQNARLPPPQQRPNADPELRDQERMAQPKKRATGIPRTFLNLSAPPNTAGEGGEESAGGNAPLLQPNTMGFQELVNRGGGQSERTAGTKRDLDYALKVTAMSVPEYLQCAICHNVVRDAMILPWDPEGRTCCESCIRDALTQNGFRCPLTDVEGVSPDDLLPNHALRKAAEQFVNTVMAKMEEIDQQPADDDDDNATAANGVEKNNVMEGDAGDSGVVLAKRFAEATRRQRSDDPFGGGDDDFGGDVFAVEAARPVVKPEDPAQVAEVKSAEATPRKEDDDLEGGPRLGTIPNATTAPTDIKPVENEQDSFRKSPVPTETSPTDGDNKRREANRRRGPPAGYAMGPAGGAAVVHENNRGRHEDSNYRGPTPRPGRGSTPDGRFGAFQGDPSGRGPGRGGWRGRGRFGPNPGYHAGPPYQGHHDYHHNRCPPPPPPPPHYPRGGYDDRQPNRYGDNYASARRERSPARKRSQSEDRQRREETRRSRDYSRDRHEDDQERPRADDQDLKPNIIGSQESVKTTKGTTSAAKTANVIVTETNTGIAVVEEIKAAAAVTTDIESRSRTIGADAALVAPKTLMTPMSEMGAVGNETTIGVRVHAPTMSLMRATINMIVARVVQGTD